MGGTSPAPRIRGEIRRILVIRRNRMGDMICALPTLHALRGAFPKAFVQIACDAPGLPIAESSGAGNRVLLLKKGFNRWHTILRNYSALRGFDLAIGVKGGFDRMLATMVRLSGAARRIGFQELVDGSRKSGYYTHPVPFPPGGEHQIETCARLVAPLGVAEVPLNLGIQLPAEAEAFASGFVAENGLERRRFFAVVNLSSNRGEHWPLEKFAEIVRCVAGRGGASVVSSLPSERSAARELARLAGAAPVHAVEPKSVLALAALLKRAAFLLTPEGGSGHLAATVGTPAIVLWEPGGTQAKWRSRGKLHFHLAGSASVADIDTAEVWARAEEAIAAAGGPP